MPIRLPGEVQAPVDNRSSVFSPSWMDRVGKWLAPGEPKMDTQEDIDRLNVEKNKNFIGKYLPDVKGYKLNSPVTQSLLPEAKHPEGESFPAFAGRGLYNSLIKPLGSPEGLLGVAQPAGGLAKGTTTVLPKIEAPIPKQLNAAPIRKMLPPATNPEILPAVTQKPSYIAGPAGVAENRGYTISPPATNPRMGASNQGTVLNQEFGQNVVIPPDMAAREGINIGAGSPIKAPVADPRLPQIYQPPINQVGDDAFAAIRAKRGADILPSAPIKPSLRKVEPPVLNPNRNMGAGVKTITDPKGKAAQKILKQNTVEPPKITDTTPPKEAVERWAWGRNAAPEYSRQVKEKFADLTDPNLITQFQRGDKTGRLADVSKYFDDTFAELKKAGILDENYKENYIRQLWDNTPEEISKALDKSTVTKTPGFSKTSVFKSYEEGIAAGLTPKFSTLPEIMAHYEGEIRTALKNKEFYDYLKNTNQIKSGKLIQSPSEWTFKGPAHEVLSKLTNNYLGRGNSSIRNVADVVSTTKNWMLGAGIPKTPFNMHGWNILRSEIMSQGYAKGTKSFFADALSPKSQMAKIKKNEGMLKELIENGMGWSNIEDHSALIRNLNRVEQKATKHIPGAGKAIELQKSLFEDPLFKLKLPADKLDFAVDRFNQLSAKGLGRGEALRKAASDANTFMGGIEKSLRDKTISDLTRIGILAPDWAESRLKLAGKSLKALIGKEDSLYLKALVRGAIMKAPKYGLSTYAGKVLYDAKEKPSDVTGIPMGDRDAGVKGNKQRIFPAYGTAVEPIKTIEEGVNKAAQGDLRAAIVDPVKNRLSAPLSSAINIATNRDNFGNSLTGKDKYGRGIPQGKQAVNMMKQFAQSVEPQQIQAARRYYAGELTLEEAIAQGLELPYRSSAPAFQPKRSSSLPRIKF